MSNEVPSTTAAPWGAYLFRVVIGLFLVGLMLAYAMTFQVYEGTNVIVTRFDRPIRTIEQSGLFWRLPWPIEKTHVIDMRKRIFSTPYAATLTRDQTNIDMLTYVVWQVKDPLLFLQSLSTGESRSDANLAAEAQSKLEGMVIDSKNTYIGMYNIESLISTNVQDIHAEEIEQRILAEVQPKVLKTFGIEILQVGIKRLAVPKDNMKTVLEKMRAERQREARRFVEEGKIAAEKIVNEAKVTSEQYRTEGRVRMGEINGEAGQKAASIEAKANSYDPEFYTFWRKMQALRQTLGGNSVIVLRNDNEFFRTLFEVPKKFESPSGSASGVVAPAAETPAVETPAVETPAVETPAVETPAVETPAVETPAVETAPSAENSASTAGSSRRLHNPVTMVRQLPIELMTLASDL